MAQEVVLDAALVEVPPDLQQAAPPPQAAAGSPVASVAAPREELEEGAGIAASSPTTPTTPSRTLRTSEEVLQRFINGDVQDVLAESAEGRAAENSLAKSIIGKQAEAPSDGDSLPPLETMPNDRPKLQKMKAKRELAHSATTGAIQGSKKIVPQEASKKVDKQMAKTLGLFGQKVDSSPQIVPAPVSQPVRKEEKTRKLPPPHDPDVADDCSTEEPATSSGEDQGLDLLKLFQAEKIPKVEHLRLLLQNRSNPNARWKNFKSSGIEFAEGCPMQLAISTGDDGLVRELLEFGANIKADYAKAAGMSNKIWSGQVTFAALPADHLDVLKLCVESHGVDVNLRSYLNLGEGKERAATLLWNAAYFGAQECTRYLLIGKADVDSDAPSQDNPLLHYTPLHTAATAGREECCKLLIQFKASLRGRCDFDVAKSGSGELHGQWYFTPLDDAIELGQIPVVKLLLRSKATLIGNQTEMREQILSKQDKNFRIDRHNYTMELLFSSRNSRAVSEVAEALQASPEQMKHLSEEDIVRFLGNPGDAPVNLMKALFVKRTSMRYWRPSTKYKDSGPTQEHFGAALILGSKGQAKRTNTSLGTIRRILVYGKVQYVINLATGPSSEDVEQHWRQRSFLQDQMSGFVDEMAPQPSEETFWPHLWCRIRGIHRDYLPVDFFACLVPHLHESEEILMAIASCPSKEIYRLRECEAIVSSHWNAIEKTHLADFFLQVVISGLVLLAVSWLRTQDIARCASLHIVAYISMPLLLINLLMEVGEALGKFRCKDRRWHLWSAEMVARDLLNHLATTALFIVFMIPQSGSTSADCQRRKDAHTDETGQPGQESLIDTPLFRVFLIGVGAMRWIHCVDMARLAFSEWNMIVTPITSAVWRTLPFCFAVLSLACILWQAYWSLDIQEWRDAWQAFIITFRFAVLNDFDVYELEGLDGYVAGSFPPNQTNSTISTPRWNVEDPETTQYQHIVQIIFVFMGGVMFPVLIMNILISVLSVWLDFAIKNVWLDFQQARARTVLKYQAMYRGLRISKNRSRRYESMGDGNTNELKSQSDAYLWFAAPKEEELVDLDVSPGIAHKFKEATAATESMDKRLRTLEQVVKSIDNSIKVNEKRRAKNATQNMFDQKQKTPVLLR
eukprot:TRINITY_DN40324_c0_g1_i1.p1 TRINITY_DN40324_c0_g1~~TRINITY_DN40324_c0_g1_i1.p1  ORF type:complete len:1135 (+),score=194.17 TRINITY_DN40324_c0_g1_i1:91-3495(+)